MQFLGDTAAHHERRELVVRGRHARALVLLQPARQLHALDRVLADRLLAPELTKDSAEIVSKMRHGLLAEPRLRGGLEHHPDVPRPHGIDGHVPDVRERVPFETSQAFLRRLHAVFALLSDDATSRLGNGLRLLRIFRCGLAREQPT
ncbi:MAG TPA: hypothetical protein VHC69_14390 [Polyangiaceae bacterium]|nr:hypothetical protein [Polyangiaceae bacterium]